jgi:carbon monoxide dehydrogenase subunit G
VRFENSFDVAAPLEEVWRTLLDVERVAPCMPGAEVLERVGENVYKVGIRVRVGPMAMTYRGEVQLADVDEQTHTATMHAKARESRGQGTADAEVHMALAEQPDGTGATLATDLKLSGRVAAMGQGVIADVAAALVATFAENLAAMLAPEPAAEPAAVPAATASGPDAATGAAATGSGAAPAATAAQPTPDDALPVGKIAASVIASRLSNPRTLAVATTAFAASCIAIGFAIGRRRRSR